MSLIEWWVCDYPIYGIFLLPFFPDLGIRGICIAITIISLWIDVIAVNSINTLFLKDSSYCTISGTGFNYTFCDRSQGDCFDKCFSNSTLCWVKVVWLSHEKKRERPANTLIYGSLNFTETLPLAIISA